MRSPEAYALTHFEIYGERPAKLADFYHELFGWRVEKAAGVDYWRIQAGHGHAAGLAHRPDPRLRGWLNYVAVESLDRAVEETRRLGGEVLRPKTAVPKAGWVAILADPDSNAFAVWQIDPTAFPPPEAE
jgi:predicted enzyme related to lactoylglutathione lyase